MSIFKANKGLLSKAMNAMYEAQGIATQQRDINFGRELLANIREYRIQQAAQEFGSSTSEGIYTSGEIGATASLQGQLTQPYQYAVDDAERQEKIESLQQTAQDYIGKYKKQAKRAKIAGYALGIVNPIGAWQAGVLGGAGRDYYSGVMRGNVTLAMSAASIGTSLASLGAGTAAATTVGGTASTVSTTTAAGSSMVASAGTTTSAISSVGNIANYTGILKSLGGMSTVFNRLSSDLKYLSQDPKVRVRLSHNLRGFA